MTCQSEYFVYFFGIKIFREAKVLTDDAIANLPTITFKTTKKPKAKKNQDETLNSEK